MLKKDTIRPISICRVQDGLFLVCYNECGFFIDKKGRRTFHDFLIYWAGSPQQFSYMHPWIIGYDSNLIEIHSIETGELQQVFYGTNIRPLNRQPEYLHFVKDENGSPQIFKISRLNQ